MLVLGGLAAGLSTGCKTTATTTVSGGVTNTVQTTSLDPERTAGVIQALVPAGVALAAEKDTNSIAYFRASSILLHALVDNGATDPAQVKATLDTISVKELRTPEAAAVTQAALGIYQAYFADVVARKLDNNQWLVPVLTAIAEGIDAGLPPLGQP
jgi:hypothetical protein